MTPCLAMERWQRIYIRLLGLFPLTRYQYALAITHAPHGIIGVWCLSWPWWFHPKVIVGYAIPEQAGRGGAVMSAFDRRRNGADHVAGHGYRSTLR